MLILGAFLHKNAKKMQVFEFFSKRVVDSGKN
jgi:hypothetical protein